jgi:tripartite-type tricarboxylate transporter receptor subunit TctC
MRTSRKALFSSFGVLIAAFVACPALAQTRPAKPLKLIIPFPPGGGSDLVGRALVDKLSPLLGQPIVVDNRPGAGANLGAEVAAKSPPDGYTLFLAVIEAHSIAVTYYKNAGYDIRRDFAPISFIAKSTSILVVAPSLPVNSLKELIALAKSKPGQLHFASSGTGGIIHLSNERFKQAAGIDIVHVPYKGTAQFLPDLMSGTIAMSLDNMPVHLPHIKAGRIRVLAIAAAERFAQLPDTPTMSEAGLPGFEAEFHYALLAPAKTPREVITRLNRDTNAALQQTELRERFAASGLRTIGGTPEAVQAAILEEVPKWAQVIKAGNIQPE